MGRDGQGEQHPNHRDRKSDGELMISLSEGTILLARQLLMSGSHACVELVRGWGVQRVREMCVRGS